jgi:hypothetical protein
MSWFVRLGLVTSLSTALFAARADAECPTFPLDQSLALSDVVFVGRAIERQYTSVPNKTIRVSTTTTFEIEDIWKGEPQKTIRVITYGGTIDGESTTVGESPVFQIGSRYVVFANGRPLTDRGCLGTALVGSERATRTLEWLSTTPHTTISN